MTTYRVDTGANLYDTDRTQRSQLVYEKSPGVDWPVNAVDYDLLRDLCDACDGVTVSGGANLEDRTAAAARAAIHAYLAARNLPTEPWDVLVNGSQPSGGTWDTGTTSLWLHVLFTATDQGVAAAPAARLGNGGDPEITWRVAEMELVEIVAGTGT